MLRMLCVALAASALASPLWAQDSTAQTDQATRSEPRGDSSDISGIKLGAGIGVTIDFGGLERISDAEVVNGVVRVKDEDDVQAGLVAEGHFFFTPDHELWGVSPGDWGHGPFVAFQTGSGTILEAAALGWMVGFRPPNSSESFNIGLGLAVHPDVQTLGDGIVRNQPLPAGETQIRYRRESQWGAIVVFSRSF